MWIKMHWIFMPFPHHQGGHEWNLTPIQERDSYFESLKFNELVLLKVLCYFLWFLKLDDPKSQMLVISCCFPSCPMNTPYKASTQGNRSYYNGEIHLKEWNCKKTIPSLQRNNDLALSCWTVSLYWYENIPL